MGTADERCLSLPHLSPKSKKVPFTAGLTERVFQLSQLVSQGSWVRYPVWPHTFVSPSAFSRRAVVSYRRKYVHEVLVNRLGSLSLPRKSVVRLTDRPDMTLDVYRGRKTTMQQQHPVISWQNPASNSYLTATLCTMTKPV